jgi:hypothetical protein
MIHYNAFHNALVFLSINLHVSSLISHCEKLAKNCELWRILTNLAKFCGVFADCFA